MTLEILPVDLSDPFHQHELIRLLDLYMCDEMGSGSPMPDGLAPRIIEGLKNHPAYLGFFALLDGQFAGLANCNRCFSTFRGKFLLNIHDLIVDPVFRRMGVGQFLLDELAAFARREGYCRLNLEVRNDNLNAQQLYKKAGYHDCNPPMYFWEKDL